MENLLAGRYSSSLEAKLGQDVRRIDQILEGKSPEYDYAVDTSARFVEANGDFRTGRSFIKAILCLLAHHEPKSFVDNAVVRMSNDYLKQANSKNYHHFFPSAFLQRLAEKGFQLPPSNHIANITVVDDFLNKRKIRDKAPSVYMADFSKQNDDLPATMKTHLINVEKDGISDDDYRKFFENRCEAISKELRKKVISREIDHMGQTVNKADLEESELSE